jgi:hypothetical protein
LQLREDLKPPSPGAQMHVTQTMAVAVVRALELEYQLALILGNSDGSFKLAQDVVWTIATGVV